MTDGTRARVAAVVGAAAKGESVSAVYDYSARSSRSASVDVPDGHVNGYDYSTKTHFSGGGSDGTLDFYDYDTRAHVQLRLDSDQFSGYDYHTREQFSGTVSGTSISLYDYQTRQHYSYSV